MSSVRFRVRRDHVLHQTIDGEVVIINLDSGNYYSLLKSGANVWSAIERNSGLEEIVAALALTYEGSRETLEGAARGLVDRLQDEGLIEAFAEAASRLPESSPSPPAPSVQIERQPFEPPLLEKYEDMQDLILLDPVHEIDEEKGWPYARREAKKGDKS